MLTRHRTPSPRSRGKPATINTRVATRHRQGRPQTPAHRLARQQSTRKRAGEAGNCTLDRERSREHAIANDRATPPDGQGNAHAHGGSGSGQKTATAHAESGHGVTDTDPRIEIRHTATESLHAESGSGQKTATAHSVSDHEKSVTRTMTASHAHDRLTANGKRQERRRRPRELNSRDLALLSSLGSRSEERDSREEKKRKQETEDSLEFSRRGTCGENWGESTD